MKNIKYMSLMMALLCVLSLGFSSCGDDDDEPAAPTVALDEVNIEGDEICVKADVKAEGRTAAILIEVRDASNGQVKVSKPVTDSKYIGVLNIDGFHVHVDIAGTGVVEGDKLKLTVTDANGRSTTDEKTLTEEEDGDEHEHEHEHEHE